MAEDVVPYDRNKGAMPLFNVERRGHVRFDSVRLTYPSRPGYRVLKDFTMEIPAEKTLGLMGHAGSGKTSLAALLLRQMRPTHGMVTIDSVDVHDFNAQYNTMVFYLGPEPLIFEVRAPSTFCLSVLSLSEHGRRYGGWSYCRTRPCRLSCTSHTC
jgi:ABC-type bacteriocin/lantibiotic exporter with double-glycine peptidase domain